ncbi:hypothetical protein ORV05_13830 [Amycolatopsis cynarae]|uniref:Uncharacterized protein n=1 Tax=Amycolatopsis cynarae TaxID=2995223 RepID=A0ABY7BC32_9PSEU|nr:hypothetical protein [Amycolatopsis sp. HUAS 11-8]WAL68797.1 hypothetical protein ORV05_13830 [Amycolatopsis sp. HUAS 11-8]
MGEIPGAREELDRLGRSLRAQLVELINDLTPGADLGLLFLDWPGVADWHEPLRYSYSAVFRGDRPEGVGAAHVASRAASLFDPAGWNIAGPEEEIDGTKRTYVLTARHSSGTRIEIRTSDRSSSVLYTGSTPALALRELEEFQWPEPVRTPETLTSGFVLCYECDGLGACHECGGRGWVPSEPHGRGNCLQCGGKHVCPICRGAGQLAVSELSPYQLTYYPKLGQRPL